MSFGGSATPKAFHIVAQGKVGEPPGEPTDALGYKCRVSPRPSELSRAPAAAYRGRNRPRLPCGLGQPPPAITNHSSAAGNPLSRNPGRRHGSPRLAGPCPGLRCFAPSGQGATQRALAPGNTYRSKPTPSVRKRSIPDGGNNLKTARPPSGRGNFVKLFPGRSLARLDITPAQNPQSENSRAPPATERGGGRRPGRKQNRNVLLEK